MRHQAIERLLPSAYQRAATSGSMLSALLEVMEDMHAPDETVLETVDDLFTAYRTRNQLLPFLARWLALDHLVPQGGTGVTGFTIEEPVNRPYHFVVRLPPTAAGQLALIRGIVDTEKPAATTAEVPDPVPPADGRGERR